MAETPETSWRRSQSQAKDCATVARQARQPPSAPVASTNVTASAEADAAVRIIHKSDGRFELSARLVFFHTIPKPRLLEAS
jgi:hypothetical protein